MVGYEKRQVVLNDLLSRFSGFLCVLLSIGIILAQLPASAEGVWVYKIVESGPMKDLEKWAVAIDIPVTETKERTTYHRLDHNSISIYRYKNSGDVVMTDHKRKYAGSSETSFALQDNEVNEIALNFLTRTRILDLYATDAIVLLGIRYVKEDVIDAMTLRKTSRVNTAIALFGRSIDGLAAFGPGAHAAVYVSGDRNIVGADVSWRKIERMFLSTQKSVDELNNEVSAFFQREYRKTLVNITKILRGYYFLDRASRQTVVPPVVLLDLVVRDDQQGLTASQVMMPMIADADLYKETPFSTRPFVLIK